MSFSIRDGQSIVTGDFSRLENLLKDLGVDHSVDVGVFKDAKTTDGESVAQYGAANEFGVIEKRIPERSFIRMPLEEKQDDIAEYVSGRAQEHLEDGEVSAIFEDIGIAAQAKIQEAFDTEGFGTWAPNAEITIALKKSDTPLIAKGLLRNAVTYEVDR